LKPLIDVQVGDILELDIPHDWFNWNKADDSAQIFKISSQFLSVIEETNSTTTLDIISMELTKLLETVQRKIAKNTSTASSNDEQQITRVTMVPKIEQG